MAELFNITHDAGNLNEYDSTVTDSGDLSAEIAAALAGTVEGMSALIDGTGAIYGQKDEVSPNTSETIRFRFYLDPNVLTMANNDNFAMVRAFSSANRVICSINLRFNSGNYQIRTFYGYDLNSTDILSDEIVSDAEHYVEILVTRAATSGSVDGSIEIWIDGVSQASKADIDNFDQFSDYDYARMGAAFGIDAGTSGTLYLDEFVMRDDNTEIGAVTTGADVPEKANYYRRQR